MKYLLSTAIMVAGFSAPTFAQDAGKVPEMPNESCYEISVPGMAGAWSTFVALNFAEEEITVTGEGSCSQVVGGGAQSFKTYFKGHYYPITTNMYVTALGFPAPPPADAKGKAWMMEANSAVQLTLPYKGDGVGSYTCRPEGGQPATYHNAIAKAVTCPPTK